MRNSQLFSRRETERKVDFRPEKDADSPFSQLRRLNTYMQQDTPTADDLSGCSEAVNYLREFVYRKTFTGTTHEQFLETEQTDPTAIDWLLAVAEVESDNFRTKRGGI